jgi:biopolymer transport protein ExbB/TolQ
MEPTPVGIDSLLQFFSKGGFFMYLLAACSVVGVAVILLRLLGLRRDLAISPSLRQEVERLQSDSEDPTGRLLALLMGDRSPLGRVIRVALKHLDTPRVENQDAVEVAAVDVDMFNNAFRFSHNDKEKYICPLLPINYHNIRANQHNEYQLLN